MSDLNDTLDDILPAGDDDRLAALFNAPIKAPVAPPATYQPRDFTEPCPKCRGRGRFISYAGRDCGPCFACKGAGKHTFKTSPEQRAAGRERTVNRREAWAEAHKAEMTWLRNAATKNDLRNGSFDFPINMINNVNKYGSLTDGQVEAVRKLMARDEARKVEQAARAEAAPEVSTAKLEAAFDHAKAKAAARGALGVWNLKLCLQSGDHALAFRPGSVGSQWEGMIFVKEGDQKLGHVKGGKFIARRECSPEQSAAVLDACNDPLKAAIAYGKAWSCCGVCGRTLTNDGSIERGIGPICAENMGW